MLRGVSPIHTPHCEGGAWFPPRVNDRISARSRGQILVANTQSDGPTGPPLAGRGAVDSIRNWPGTYSFAQNQSAKRGLRKLQIGRTVLTLKSLLWVEMYFPSCDGMSLLLGHARTTIAFWVGSKTDFLS
jgi:hypothetical protein